MTVKVNDLASATRLRALTGQRRDGDTGVKDGRYYEKLVRTTRGAHAKTSINSPGETLSKALRGGKERSDTKESVSCWLTD